VVGTEAGDVRGGRYGGVAVFREVPFGRAPVGSLRFARPEPAPAWDGVLDCSSEQAEEMVEGFCAQVAVGGHVVGREDCLKLHVFRPDGTPAPGGRDESKRPVYVYIHGGMFWTEDGVELTIHDPKKFAAEMGFLVVVVQYRLGVMGFFASRALADEDWDHSTGNYGLQDQRLALEWVQKNAAAFGGDPSSVTIHGVSAGAISVCAHVYSPASAGLFHRAIVQSGNCDNQYVFAPRTTAESVSDLFAARVGCGKDGTRHQPDETAACLRSAPLEELITHQLYPLGTRPDRDLVPMAPILPWVPVVDGSTSGLPLRPADGFARGDFNRVPILMGTTHNEGSLFAPLLPFMTTRPRAPLRELSEQLSRMFSEKGADLVLKQFPWAGHKKDPLRYRQLTDIITTYIFTCAAQRTTRVLHAAGHADVWQWHFQYDDHSTFYHLFGDYHTNESKFIFGPKFGKYHLPGNKFMQELIQGYWLNFVLEGNPNGAGGESGLFHWERSSPEGVLIMQKDPEMKEVVFPDHCRFWDDFPFKPLPVDPGDVR